VGREGIVKISIINSLGDEITTKSVAYSTGQFEGAFDVENLSVGIYSIKGEAEEVILMQKLVKN
jgi:hypothetical protein